MSTKIKSLSLTSSFNMPMTSVKLNGKNNVFWLKSVEVCLKGKGLSSHLVYTKPNPTSPTFAQWEQEGAQILSLMLSSRSVGASQAEVLGVGNITHIYKLCKRRPMVLQ